VARGDGEGDASALGRRLGMMSGVVVLVGEGLADGDAVADELALGVGAAHWAALSLVRR